jgi:hypothetical protein
LDLTGVENSFLALKYARKQKKISLKHSHYDPQTNCPDIIPVARVVGKRK